MEIKKYLAELLGTFFLVATVIGSGIMGENLSAGNPAIALLGNTIATGAILYVIIKSFEDVSGAHFNPIVSIIFYFLDEINLKDLISYLIIQFIAGILAVFFVHFIFELSLFQISSNSRIGMSMFFSEIIASFGLILTILMVRKNNKSNVAISVALFITAGYWFTSSTSFANPAVTLARTFTDTFTGISPESIIYFFSGQLVGLFIAFYIYKFLR
ncbi:aquaporin family protein [Gammaproteobacteria bacterium]|nr:aquaporin family protein [Gammaproteobacteria bacterium]MDC2965495.1 aquaporin family protein [Gammaproteobacteria bacterium]MDC3045465.1 aquaporin family protein [Gammaproteobacteria bacterium]